LPFILPPIPALDGFLPERKEYKGQRGSEQFLTSPEDQQTHSRQKALIADKGVSETFLVLPVLVLILCAIAICNPVTY